MKNLKYNIYLKIGIISFIAIILLIPATMIKQLIRERERTQNEAIEEVSSKWATDQTICGPVITVPYKTGGRTYQNNKYQSDINYLHILPDQLDITGSIDPRTRYRGVYEVIVYGSKLNLTGSFSNLNLESLELSPEDILWDKAKLEIGISDLRGIENQLTVDWNDTTSIFNPGLYNEDISYKGISAVIELDSTDKKHTFSIQLELKGSQQLYFTPVGQVTNIEVNSNWPTPSFNGAFLPDGRVVTKSGFNAHWNVLHLNRNFPQAWTQKRYSLSNSEFGVDLRLPVDSYQKSERTVKYAFLFIVLTFLSFLSIEIMNKVLIHPIQYILVGFALVLFYTLLISFSEHFTFNIAFITSMLATIFLIAGYIKAILKSNKFMILMVAILFTLYSFIFVIIQLENYSLLIGSIGIFMILGLTMYFSRKIDWYDLSLGQSKKEDI